MKRWLGWIMAVILIFAQCPALGEAAPPEPSFADALVDWAGGMDLSRSDYRGTLRADGETYTARLRQYGGLTELSADDLGKIQFSDGKIAVNADGETYVVDVASILAGLQSHAAPQVAPEDAERLRALLRRAAREIWGPSIEVRYDRDGVGIHLDLDEAELVGRLSGFIDRALQEGTDVALLLSRYGQYLKMMDAAMPSTLEEVRAAWEGIKPQLAMQTRVSRVSFEMDATAYRADAGDLQVAGAGSLSVYGRQYAIGFEYLPDDDGFSMGLSVNGTAGRTASGFVATLDAHGDALKGTLTIDGRSPRLYALDAVAGDGALQAALKATEDGRDTWELRLTGRTDARTGALSAALDQTRYPDDPIAEPETENLATLEARLWSDGVTGTLAVPGGTLDLRAVGGNGYAHATLRATSDSAMCENYDVTFFRMGRGFRMRCEQTRSRQGMLMDRTVLTGTVTPNELSFALNDPIRSASISGRLYCLPFYGSHGEFEIEFLNDLRGYAARSFRTPVPFRLRVVREGRTFTVNFSNGNLRDPMTVDATFALDEGGALASLEAQATRGPADRPDRQSTAGLTYRPGEATLTDGDETYTLTRLFESADRLTYLLSYSEDPTPATLDLRIDAAAGKLTGTLSFGDEVLAEVEIAPEAKTPIIPISEVGATVIDLEALMQAMQTY